MLMLTAEDRIQKDDPKEDNLDISERAKNFTDALLKLFATLQSEIKFVESSTDSKLDEALDRVKPAEDSDAPFKQKQEELKKSLHDNAEEAAKYVLEALNSTVSILKLMVLSSAK